jgi:uncharacterized Fe-S cluster-containing radical SAM superfamily protein
LSSGYDPIVRASRVSELVCRSEGGVESRLYYRFRADRWYGGIVTGDVIGCNLSCVFCWSWRFKDNPALGKPYKPSEVVERIVAIARGRGFGRVRLSGGEPTICRKHLIEVAGLLEGYDLEFIVETNGLLLGYDRGYAREFSRFTNVVARVSFKGVSPEEFHRLTGARPEFYELQFKALENLIDAGLEPGVRVYPAAMIGFSSDDGVKAFVERLSNIHPALADVDWEYVIMYQHVRERLEKLKIKPLRAVDPRGVPLEMI